MACKGVVVWSLFALIVYDRFRWVVCQLEVLRHCLPPSVRRILGGMPETLDETYERILLDIPKANQMYAHRLLQCLTVAARPLKVDELAEVLAIDFSVAGETPRLNEELRWKDQEQAVLSACSSLVTVIDDGNSRIVQFAHFSVKEFLTSGRLAASKVDTLHYHHIPLEPAHTIMAKACLCVLLRLDYLIDEQSIKNIPLAEYSAHYFAKHVDFEDVISQIEDGIDRLLDTEKPHFGAWVWIAVIRTTSSPEQPEGNPLHYIAELGSSSLARHLISKHPEYLHTRVDHLGTPLHQAVHSSHVEVFEILVEQYVDVDVRDFKDRTPLHLAAYNGCFDISRILIGRGADINARNGKGQTPLHRVVDRLVDISNDFYFDVLAFLLGHGADVNAQDNDHSTPLHIASYWGCTKAVQMMLEHGADPHMKNDAGQTPFQVASAREEEAVMGLLLGHTQRGSNLKP
jgi:hypothetical protein